MGFKAIHTGIEGLTIIEPDVFGDHRGFFQETYNQQAFAEMGLHMNFLQDNMSFSGKGILRGLHFQAPPHAQGKLVSVIQGRVLDVAVDIRRSSPTYGQHYSIELSGENHRMFYVPEGFAHGFVVLSETAYFVYKCTRMYHRPAEGGLMWNDPGLGIDWGIENPIISDKDKEYGAFSEFESPFP